jgi:radical SAM protein with 4Fe4S-binding SPASM domain
MDFAGMSPGVPARAGGAIGRLNRRGGRKSVMNGKLEYYRRLAKLYRGYIRRDAVMPAPPLRVWVEISSRCNLRCPACPNKDLAAGQKGDMDWPLFKKVIDQAHPFAFEINLHHRGETLLHPQAGRFIRYAAATGTACRLHTNATLLQGPIVDDILASGLRSLSVSMDGFSADVYEKNRVGAGFDQVSRNIAGFLQRRRQLRRKRPRLAIEVMEFSALAGGEERRAFGAQYKKLGLDELVSKKPHNWAGYLAATKNTAPVTACTFPWNALVVLFNGDVSPCSQDFFAQRILGNAGEKPLLEIWNGQPMQELRRAFAGGRTAASPPCSACDRIRRPTLGGVPTEYLKRLARRRMP